MANHTATKKSIRKNVNRTEVNKNRKSRVRTFLKRVDLAIGEGKKKEATEALKAAESEIMKAAQRGVYKVNTAARKVSRLSARVKALS